jgi:predicted NACHT family NTPase
MGMARATISNFLNGKSVDFTTFVEICERLELDWQAIAYLEDAPSAETEQPPNPPQEQSEQENSIDIDALVQEVREKVKPSIQEWCGTMKVLDMSEFILLNNIYTDVNILEKITGRRRLGINELMQEFNPESEEFNQFGINKFSEKGVSGIEAVKRYHKLILLGKAGGGKTTFLKHLATQCNCGNLNSDLVPILVIVNQFVENSNQQDLLKFIVHQLLDCDINETQIFELLKHGRVFILIDGLDEVSENDSVRVINSIKTFLRRYHKNKFVLTCRIAGQDYDFDNFTEVELADFDNRQIAQFVEKWFHSRNKIKKAELLLKNLTKQIKELATNPLLLTLLCVVFEETGEFPPNRFEIYKEAIDVLLTKWDSRRNIERRHIYKKLSIRGKRNLLSHIAHQTFEKSAYYFKQKDLEQVIADYIRNLPQAETDPEELQSDSEKVLKAIEAQHGLLVERARGIYSFSHQTFQEYFMGRQIASISDPQASESALKKLAEHITERRWREVFEVAVGMLQSADYLLRLMKQQVDSLVAKDKKLQEFLEWVNQKSLSFNLPYKRSAIRAFYLDIDIDLDVDRTLGCVIDLTCTCIFSYASLLSRVLNRELTDTVDMALEFDPALAHEPALEPALAIAVKRTLAMSKLESNFGSELEPNLRQELQQLKEQLPDPNGDKEILRHWWKTNGWAWANQVRAVIVFNHKIGKEDWSFTDDQRKLLRQYYDTNLLLLECLNIGYVSYKVRQEIEDTLLLPQAEIERLKSKR